MESNLNTSSAFDSSYQALQDHFIQFPMDRSKDDHLGPEMVSPSSEATVNGSENSEEKRVASIPLPEALNNNKTEEDSSVDPPKSVRFYATIVFLSMASCVASIDTVIIGPCLSAIAAELNTTSLETFWVGTSYLLACTVTIPIYGSMSNIFGRKSLMMIGLSLFLFASIMCSTAKNAPWLIGARTVQGIGGGALFNLVSVITSDITTMRERGKYLAFSAMAWGLGVSGGVSQPLLSNHGSHLCEG
jgi:hypothetical protein